MKKETICAAFPEKCHMAAAAIGAHVFSRPYRHLSTGGMFSAIIDNECIRAPYRMYCEYSRSRIDRSPDPLQRILLSCLFSRHYDGYVREDCIRKILENPHDAEPFVIPYILKAAEEYVVSITVLVEERLPMFPPHPLARFLAENPRWLPLMRSRCASYWNCYHRHDYPKLADYPGERLVLFLSGMSCSRI